MSRRDQLVRTFTVLRLLSRPNGASMPELEEELGVSRRTLQRDMAALEDAGFPLVAVGDDWPPRRRVSSDSTRFGGIAVGLGDLLALRIAQRALASNGSADVAAALESLLEQLRPMAPASARSHLTRLESLDGAGAGRQPRLTTSAVLASLVAGVAECRAVRVDYASRSRRGRAWREVLPYAVVPRRSGIYLVGPEAGTAEIRHYRLDRLHGVELTSRRFVRPAAFSVDRHFGDAFGVHRGSVQEVRIRFSADAAAYVRGRSWHASQELTDAPDGSLELSMRVGGMPEVKSWVQSFGAAATVLAPASLADEIEREARLVAGRAAERSPRRPAARRAVGRQAMES